MKPMVETKHDLLTSNYTQVFEEANPQSYAPSTFIQSFKGASQGRLYFRIFFIS